MPILQLAALSGFLVKDEDWMQWEAPDLGVSALHVCDPRSYASASEGFSGFAQRFNHKMRQKSQQPQAILGYSLGGRLALHALLANPQQWALAIIISAHPGLSEENEKDARRQKDAAWASAFLNEPWDSLMDKWENQEVFRSSRHLMSRKEKDFNRSDLADCLLHYSVGNQEDLRNRVASLRMPILWMVGEKDAKFLSIGKSLSFAHSKSTLKVIAKAGHRIPWEQPEEFQSSIYSFIRGVYA